MQSFVIDGRAVADQVIDSLHAEVDKIRRDLGRVPGLAVVLVGENPASKVYVAAKSRAAMRCGIQTFDNVLSEDTTDSELTHRLAQLSADERIDGILLQLPLPKGLDESRAISCIPAGLDVDGLTSVNQGRLMRGEAGHRPCTPRGILELIDYANSKLGLGSSLEGKHAVVIGRSTLVGKPVALMLLERNCTVTLCHSKTRDLAGVARDAEILVAAVGRPALITAEYVREGAIVIDVGINRLPDGKLVGDVDFEAAKMRAAALTPVPGGVGPMTIAMLLSNTVDSAKGKISAN